MDGMTIEEAARDMGMVTHVEQAASPDLPWHLVTLAGKSYQTTLYWLHQRNIEAYYPMLREIRKVPKRELSKKQRADGNEISRPKLVPCFTNYTFVRFDMGKEGWREIFEYAGITGMISSGGVPVRIPDSDIACMKGSEVDGAIPGITALREIFAVGERVRIDTGPFTDFAGPIEEKLDMPIQDIDAATRIKVAINYFGRSTPVSVHPSQVSRLYT